MAALGEDLLGTVNKLQDLVFNTIGNDSLDLPQIVCMIIAAAAAAPSYYPSPRTSMLTLRALYRLWSAPNLQESPRSSRISSVEISYPVAAASSLGDRSSSS